MATNVGAGICGTNNGCVAVYKHTSLVAMTMTMAITIMKPTRAIDLRNHLR
jgi:hypothetical protein